MAKSFFADMLDEKPQGVLAQAIAQPKRNGTMHTIGIIADALATLGGAQPGYRMGLEHREDRNAAQQRQSLLDQLTQAQIATARNPKPAAPHYWETNDGSLGMIGPDGKPSIAYQDPTKKIDWIQVKDPATGAISIMPLPQGVAPVGPPPGVTFKPRAGGASPSGSRTFPLR